MSGVVKLIASYAMFLLPFMYTDRILRPYGSASKRPRIGILSDERTLLRKRRVATSGCPLPEMITHGYVL